MLTTISTPTVNASDKNQLSITAQKIMTQIMLDPGYPYNWGNTTEAPQVFGLAMYGQTSRQAYQLDPDKVMRLNNSIAGNVPPNTALKLLNLANDQGAAEYGFTLQFKDTIQINVVPQPEQANSECYSITATSDYALPIVGAKVSAVLYYIEDTRIQHTDTVHGVTAYNGSYTALFPTPPQTAKVLAVTVDYYGEQTAKFYQVTPGPEATLFQSKLIPTADQPYQLGSLRDPHEIILVDNGNGLETNDLPIQIDGTSLSLGTPLEPSAIAVLAFSGDNLLLANRDFSHISYQTINFKDPAVHSAAFSYSLERTVVIAGSTYTATLYLWRMST